MPFREQQNAQKWASRKHLHTVGKKNGFVYIESYIIKVLVLAHLNFLICLAAAAAAAATAKWLCLRGVTAINIWQNNAKFLYAKTGLHAPLRPRGVLIFAGS